MSNEFLLFATSLGALVFVSLIVFLVSIHQELHKNKIPDPNLLTDEEFQNPNHPHHAEDKELIQSGKACEVRWTAVGTHHWRRTVYQRQTDVGRIIEEKYGRDPRLN